MYSYNLIYKNMNYNDYKNNYYQKNDNYYYLNDGLSQIIDNLKSELNIKLNYCDCSFFYFSTFNKGFFSLFIKGSMKINKYQVLILHLHSFYP